MSSWIDRQSHGMMPPPASILWGLPKPRQTPWAVLPPNYKSSVSTCLLGLFSCLPDSRIQKSNTNASGLVTRLCVPVMVQCLWQRMCMRDTGCVGLPVSHHTPTLFSIFSLLHPPLSSPLPVFTHLPLRPTPPSLHTRIPSMAGPQPEVIELSEDEKM